MWGHSNACPVQLVKSAYSHNNNNSNNVNFRLKRGYDRDFELFAAISVIKLDTCLVTHRTNELQTCHTFFPLFFYVCFFVLSHNFTLPIYLFQSLGFPLAELTGINRTTAELLYVKGDPCPTDKAMNLSTRIHFSCNMRAGRVSTKGQG